MTATLRQRDEVPIANTWDLASMFADVSAWESAAADFQSELERVRMFSGRLGESGRTLLDWFRYDAELMVQVDRLLTYALMAFDSNTTDSPAAALRDRAIGLLSRYHADVAFVVPELLGLGPARLDALLEEEPDLALYRHAIDNMLRRRAHVRSEEVEALLAAANDPFSTPFIVYSTLADGDLQFADAVDADGRHHHVARGNAESLLCAADRVLRKSVWESYMDGFLAYKSTFGALYAGSVRTDVFRARARGFASTLDAVLHTNNVPRAVYDTVISAWRKHLPIWHRYWDVRRRALGLDLMEPCDIFAPLAETPHITYAEAVEMICAGVAPLGDDYVETARYGLTDGRWVDVYPSQGKTSGAYSGGSYGTHPFILMNYDDSLMAMSTLAHELGHSMHTWYTNQAQPPVYSNYSLFVAEVASNFNQALVRGHLLAQGGSRSFQIALIEEAIANFHRYLFVMPILSQFEQYAHERVEADHPPTSDELGVMLANLFEEAYGPAVRVDRERDGIFWAQFPHLYESYYVYQYASGIAAANALADQVLQGTAGAVERYRRLLACGSSCYPLDALKLAGIDMTSTEPLERAFGVLAGFVDRLEGLLFNAEGADHD
jgi:oligoendopeptidase F